jgi:hypothetical protein
LGTDTAKLGRLLVRRKRIKQELAALGFSKCEDHIPTDEYRNRVRMYVINKVEHEVIARVLDIPVGVLRYFYWRELSNTDVEAQARMAQNILELATQRNDLGVALRASEFFLKAHSSTWREPRPVDPDRQGEVLRVGRLTLEQVEQALARIGATTVDAGAGDPERPEGSE